MFSAHALVPQASANVTCDALRDFAPVASLVRQSTGLEQSGVVDNSRLRGIAYVKARPGAFNFAGGGIGSPNQIDMELLKSATGLEIVRVPYNGPAAAFAAVASGDAQAMIAKVTTRLPLAQSGRIRHWVA